MPAVAGDGLDASPRGGGDIVTDAPAAIPVVLDTNVWIDILVYNDPASRPIRAALESGRLDAIIDTACLYELDRVLDYPQFARFTIDKAAALAITHALTRQLPPQSTEAEGTAGTVGVPPTAPHMPTLPRCSDRDDQKFLELAAFGQARWLVTKDKALLKLAKRFARDFDCRIDRPAAFVSAELPSAVPD